MISTPSCVNWRKAQKHEATSKMHNGRLRSQKPLDLKIGLEQRRLKAQNQMPKRRSKKNFLTLLWYTPQMITFGTITYMEINWFGFMTIYRTFFYTKWVLFCILSIGDVEITKSVNMKKKLWVSEKSNKSIFHVKSTSQNHGGIFSYNFSHFSDGAVFASFFAKSLKSWTQPNFATLWPKLNNFSLLGVFPFTTKKK